MNINSLIFDIEELNDTNEISLMDLIDSKVYFKKDEYEVIASDEVEYKLFFETEVYENTLSVDYRISTEIFRIENMDGETICYIGRQVENRYNPCEENYEREYLDFKEIKPVKRTITEWRFADEHGRTK